MTLLTYLLVICGIKSISELHVCMLSFFKLIWSRRLNFPWEMNIIHTWLLRNKKDFLIWQKCQTLAPFTIFGKRIFIGVQCNNFSLQFKCCNPSLEIIWRFYNIFWLFSGRSFPLHHRLRFRLPFPRIPIARLFRRPDRDRSRREPRPLAHGQVRIGKGQGRPLPWRIRSCQRTPCCSRWQRRCKWFKTSFRFTNNFVFGRFFLKNPDFPFPVF